MEKPLSGLLKHLSQEFKPGIKNKVPIPNVCQAFKVPCIDTFTMLRIMGVKLIGFEIA
jgi:hypothetical protein